MFLAMLGIQAMIIGVIFIIGYLDMKSKGKDHGKSIIFLYGFLIIILSILNGLLYI